MNSPDLFERHMKFLTDGILEATAVQAQVVKYWQNKTDRAENRVTQLEDALQAILDNAVLDTGTVAGDKYQIDDDILHAAHALLHDQPGTVTPPTDKTPTTREDTP